jgi:formylglycine-generating enzyme required for sulfatase activity
MGSDSVAHVSLEVARGCAAKFGQLQPTEDQWHYTATGLTRGRMYPWRSSLTVDGEPPNRVVTNGHVGFRTIYRSPSPESHASKGTL